MLLKRLGVGGGRESYKPRRARKTPKQNYVSLQRGRTEKMKAVREGRNEKRAKEEGGKPQKASCWAKSPIIREESETFGLLEKKRV